MLWVPKGMAASTKHHGCSLKHNLEDTEEGKSAESSKLWPTCCKRVHTAYGKPNFNFISRHPLCLSGGIGNNNKKANSISMLPVNPISLLLFQEFTIEMGFCTFFKLLLESIWECVMRWTEIPFKRSSELRDFRNPFAETEIRCAVWWARMHRFEIL